MAEDFIGLPPLELAKPLASREPRRGNSFNTLFFQCILMGDDIFSEDVRENSANPTAVSCNIIPTL
jgi:hypothetical protein